jgi:hypothetical protein
MCGFLLRILYYIEKKLLDCFLTTKIRMGYCFVKFLCWSLPGTDTLILLRGIQLTHVQRDWGSTVKMELTFKIFFSKWGQCMCGAPQRLKAFGAHFPSVITIIMDQKLQLLKFWNIQLWPPQYSALSIVHENTSRSFVRELYSTRFLCQRVVGGLKLSMFSLSFYLYVPNNWRGSW